MTTSNQAVPGLPTQAADLFTSSDGAIVHRLNDIASQLEKLEEEPLRSSDPSPPRRTKPEVVFLDASEVPPQTIIEVTLSQEAPLASVRQAFGHPAPEINEPQNNLPSPSQPPLENTQSQGQAQYREAVAIDPTSDGRLVVDPFNYQDIGDMPMMTTLPVLEANRMTEATIARQASGEHHAWVLATAEQQLRELPLDVSGPFGPVDFSQTTTTNEIAIDQQEQPIDCFFAEPGQVIFVDGNLGFDHIDVRSYSIECATFLPGSILLHSDIDPSLLQDGEPQVAPITIRYKGVKFAVFSGDVTVEL